MSKGCEEIYPQGEIKKCSSDLQKGKLILSKNSLKKIPEKGQRLGKKTLLKSQLFQTYFLQPTNYVFYFSGITLSNNNYRRKNSHHNRAQLLSNSCNPIPIGGVQICLPLSFISYCLLKREPITLCLTGLYFCRTVCKHKVILKKFDSKSTFQTCRQNGSQSKVTALVLISPFRGKFIVIFRRIYCNEEQQVLSCWFLS